MLIRDRKSVVSPHLHVILRLQLVSHKRAVPALDAFFTAALDQLWPYLDRSLTENAYSRSEERRVSPSSPHPPPSTSQPQASSSSTGRFFHGCAGSTLALFGSLANRECLFEIGRASCLPIFTSSSAFN